MTILVPVATVIALFAVRVPIGFALGIAGILGLFLAGGAEAMAGLLAITPYREAASFILTTVPMFVLMAEFVTQGELAKGLYNVAYKWLGHLPGGLAVATVAASSVMGAMTGASTAAAAAMANASMPEMMRYRYKRWLAAGTVAVGGTLAIMIPPSIPMVIYGVQTETSIGKLFIAGIIPGLLLAALYAATIILMVSMRPDLALRAKPFPLQERIAALRDVWPVVVLVALVIGGMYLGLVTPTEAGALGAAGALAITLMLRRIGLNGILTALSNASMTTAMIMTIVIGAHFFSYFLTMAGVTDLVARLLEGMHLAPVVTILVVIVPIYILLGMFMDNIPILLLTLPVIFPLVVKWGFDPIWFGVLVIALGEMGLITPPVGLAVFVVSTVSDVPLDEAFKGIVPFLAADIVLVGLLIAFPQIATFLPGLMK